MGVLIASLVGTDTWWKEAVKIYLAIAGMQRCSDIPELLQAVPFVVMILREIRS